MTRAAHTPSRPASGTPWLFGRRVDLLAFGGSAAASMLLLAVGAGAGWLNGETPFVLWLLLVICIDVAHVWTTLFRVYLDGAEVRRRPWLYGLTPALTYAVLLVLHAMSSATFWTGLAYVAVFHFVRQQVGWLALYDRRGPRPSPVDRLLERATLYAVMVYPLVYWHAHLPRDFHWFVAGDFVPGLPSALAGWLAGPYWALLAAFTGRQLWLVRIGQLHPGKLQLIATTWACWHLGIVTFGSDYGFTVTNVIIHGAPYAVLVYRYARAQTRRRPKALVARLLGAGALGYAAFCIALGLLEELLWDTWVWHEYGFYPVPVSPTTLAWLVPLLALPQATHYVLDGVVWRRGPNPHVAAALAGS